MAKRHGRRFQKPKAKKSPRLSAQETINYDDFPPIFSLQRIQNSKYCLSKLEKNDKALFADAIYKRREIPWKDIKKISRHALGFEKIPKNMIKASIPRFITDDVEDFIAFRFSGMKPMVGYRQKDVFFVLWFDHDYTLYDH